MSRYLRLRGVARSSAYRWRGELESLVEGGGRELRRLRRKRAELAARLAEAPVGPEDAGELHATVAGALEAMRHTPQGRPSRTSRCSPRG